MEDTRNPTTELLSTFNGEIVEWMTSELQGYAFKINMLEEMHKICDIEQGRLYKEIKDNDIHHGHWLEFIEKYTPHSEREVQRKMQMFEEFGNTTQASLLPKSKLIELMQYPKSINRTELVDKVGDKSRQEIRDLKAKVKELEKQGVESNKLLDEALKQLEKEKTNSKSKDDEVSELKSKIDRLYDEKEDLYEQLQSVEPEVITETIEVPVEKVVIDTSLQAEVDKLNKKLNDNTKALEEANRRANLAEAKARKLADDNITSTVRVKSEEKLEEFIPDTIDTLKKLAKQIGYLINWSGGWDDIDGELFEEFSDNFNKTSSLMEELLNTVNSEVK